MLSMARFFCSSMRYCTYVKRGGKEVFNVWKWKLPPQASAQSGTQQSRSNYDCPNSIYPTAELPYGKTQRPRSRLYRSQISFNLESSWRVLSNLHLCSFPSSKIHLLVIFRVDFWWISAFLRQLVLYFSCGFMLNFEQMLSESHRLFSLIFLNRAGPTTSGPYPKNATKMFNAENLKKIEKKMQ